MATESGTLTPRPYARLLSMLSNQLIKNDTIALTELAKNSYDADASWVQIRIGNIGNLGKTVMDKANEPFVEIEDDGDGMSFDTIQDAWMNPASPGKYNLRRGGKGKTRKGRIIQGEKGIGRYAVFQIGKKVEIYTRERIDVNQGGKETNLITDTSGYTDELFSVKSPQLPLQTLFFDQLVSQYNIRDEPIQIKPGKIIIEGQTETRKNHGTLIRITGLNYVWTLSNVKRIREILSRLQSPFRKNDFAVSIVFEGAEIAVFEEFKLDDILDNATLKFDGHVDDTGLCTFSLNGVKDSLDLVGYLKQDWVLENRDYFFDAGKRRMPQCGPFDLKFFVYDFEKISDDKLKRYLRAHRTYIYRDDIRVYPYGDSDNDWIKLDTYRGIVKASYYLSNDQLKGYVSISAKNNPSLIDKTNREGLIEQGAAYEDLRMLTLSALDFLNTEFRKTKDNPLPKHQKERTSGLFLQTEKVGERIHSLQEHLANINDEKGQELLGKVDDDYQLEKSIYRKQVAIVEDLAGVGISVDAASHDFMVVMNRAAEKINELQSLTRSDTIDTRRLREKIDSLHEQMLFMTSLLAGIQPLFRSSRKISKALKISDVIETVKRYYDAPLKKIHIIVEIIETGTPFVMESNEGVLLQVFINLMDNSVYWLKVSDTKEPKIVVQIDSSKGYVIFADNGPGVKPQDVDYIFEPFFSTKGIQGRGLGLYIARQLTDRYGYDLYYLNKQDEKILPGANFRIDFNEQEE